MNCSSTFLWAIYFAFIRSILTYCYPAMCNMPANLFKQLVKTERRVEAIIGYKCPIDILTFCRNICIKPIDKINKTPTHPLLIMWDVKQLSHHALRSTTNISIPYCSSSRRLNSIYRFLPKNLYI